MIIPTLINLMLGCTKCLGLRLQYQQNYFLQAFNFFLILQKEQETASASTRGLHSGRETDGEPQEGPTTYQEQTCF